MVSACEAAVAGLVEHVILMACEDCPIWARNVFAWASMAGVWVLQKGLTTPTAAAVAQAFCSHEINKFRLEIKLFVFAVRVAIREVAEVCSDWQSPIDE